MEKQFGGDLKKDTSIVNFESLMEAEEYICIYFGAHWCPPCRLFTSILSEVYNSINKEKKVIEVIFATYDGNEEAFERNFADMPWLAFPWEDTRLKVSKQKYGVTGLPTLVVLDKKG